MLRPQRYVAGRGRGGNPETTPNAGRGRSEQTAGGGAGADEKVDWG